MELLKEKNIQEFIKYSILELSTNIEIDHRGYCEDDEIKPSAIIEKIEKNDNNFELGILELSKEIIENKNIIDMCKNFDKLNKKKKILENKLSILENDKSMGKKKMIENKLLILEDDIVEIESILFEDIIKLTGLYEINSIHGDNYSKFKYKFMKW
jgi:hypothetical protein